jgi:hypothetical protein
MKDESWLTTARDQPLDHLDTFATSLDAALVTQALEATGTASVRRRKLPAERAVWLILGMALLRDRSIQAVCLGLCPRHIQQNGRHPQ